LAARTGYFKPGRSKSAPEDPQKQIALLIEGKSSDELPGLSWQPQAERNPPRWLTQWEQLQQVEKTSEEKSWQEHSNFVLGMIKPIWKTKRMKKIASILFFIWSSCY
jgi:hypothetical protein